MPSPISFGPKDPDSWRLSWMGHAGGSGDPARTSPNSPPPPPPPSSAPAPGPALPVNSGKTVTVGPQATWPNGFQDSTVPNYPAFFVDGPGAP